MPSAHADSPAEVLRQRASHFDVLASEALRDESYIKAASYGATALALREVADAFDPERPAT